MTDLAILVMSRMSRPDIGIIPLLHDKTGARRIVSMYNYNLRIAYFSRRVENQLSG
jgi:hypothetical protein